MQPRLTLALLASRGASWISRRFGRGGGTVLPGHIVPRIDPRALSTIAARLPAGSLLVSGTNGKTTTTRMVSQIVSRAGLVPIHNRSGANLMTGIVSAVTANADLSGNPRGDIGIFEADEAHVPVAVAALQPRVLALTNVFRDQLDRYGEVELVVQTWRRAISILRPDATLVLNADDPIIAQLGEDAPCTVVFFGLETRSIGSARLPHEADKRLCHRCGARIQYTWAYYGHIGHYRCSGCGWHRPEPAVRISAAKPRRDGGTDLTIEAAGERFEVSLPLSGLYNACNALAAVTVCRAVGIASEHIVEGLAAVEAVFGRQERIAIGDGSIVLNLVKNPVGFNQVLNALFGSEFGVASAESVTAERGTRNAERGTLLVIAINDLFADGTDVSWLWDVDFEMLSGRSLKIVCTGLRAHDMALRLKYAGVGEDAVQVEPRIEDAVDRAVRAAAAGAQVLVCPTYTAMLAVRSELQRRGAVAPFWED